MIKNYFKTFWKIAVQSKLYMFLSLFGISLTIMFVMIFTMTMTRILWGSGPESDMRKIIFAKRLEAITGTAASGDENSTIAALSPSLCEKYLKKVKSADLVSFYNLQGWDFMYNGQRQEKKANLTDADFWKIFHYTFLSGKPYSEEDVNNGVNGAVITESLKTLMFGDEKQVLGKVIDYEKLQLTVIGVVKDPPGTCWNAAGDIYFPYTLMKSRLEPIHPGNYITAFKFSSKKQSVRIKAEVQDIISRLDAENDQVRLQLSGPNSQFEILMTGVDSISEITSNWAKFFRYIGICIGFLLLPAINLMALNYARIHQRNEEIAIRKSFGARTGMLQRQLIFENFILVLGGGLIGILLSFLTVVLFGDVLSIPVSESGRVNISFSFNIVAFLITLGGCFLFTIFSGLLPAIRLSKLNPAGQLSGGEL
jgi:putative ABC transport system permease protein